MAMNPLQQGAAPANTGPRTHRLKLRGAA